MGQVATGMDLNHKLKLSLNVLSQPIFLVSHVFFQFFMVPCSFLHISCYHLTNCTPLTTVRPNGCHSHYGEAQAEKESPDETTATILWSLLKVVI